MAASNETTTLDDDVTKPSVTAPGDGPADTTDPSEGATSVTPTPGDEAKAAGTVNAVQPVKATAKKSTGRRTKKDDDERVEEYQATKPNGDVVTVRRNIETGASEIV